MGIFTHISAYSDISMHIQPDIFRHIQNPVNPNIFRTLIYSERWQIQNQRHIQSIGIFKTLAYSEPWHLQNERHIQNSGVFRTRGIFRTLGCFVKIVNILYEINILNSFNTCVIFPPIVFILCKKDMDAQGVRVMNFP